jgi:hypothetical protein
MTWTWKMGEAATYLVTTGYLKGEWMHCKARVYSQTSLDSEIAILGNQCNMVISFSNRIRQSILRYTTSIQDI